MIAAKPIVSCGNTGRANNIHRFQPPELQMVKLWANKLA